MARTALDLSPDEWALYDPASMIQHRQAAEQKLLARRQRQALQAARRAARLLRGEFGAAKVVVFGSLAASGHFTRWSDIDMAAWGIPAERYYAAVAAVTGMSARFKIDLIDPENCSPGLRAAIERDGVIL